MINRILVLIAILSVVPITGAASQDVIVGSKKFTESYVLGEVIKRTLVVAGQPASHKQGIGATGIAWAALTSGAISVYPEYTGTIAEEILKDPGLSDEKIRSELRKLNIGMTGDLGFNDTYALAMRSSDAKRLSITKISDLKNHPEVRAAITHEFLGRKDGWKPLSQKYGLNLLDVRGVDHTIGYQALENGQADLKDAYSTDAKLVDPKFVTLIDDLHYFPSYRAVLLYRLDLSPRIITALKSMENRIDEPKMIAMNALAEKTKDYSIAANMYFGDDKAQKNNKPTLSESTTSRLVKWTFQHLRLVLISLFASILVGLPLGIVASRGGFIGQLILSIVGIIQTIPSLALLAFLVPLPYFGISSVTAITALFLYSLLPIVRNTASGLQDISPASREAAEALGMESGAVMRKIYLPMASRSILTGIKTSAIINVGTATLAALIGAGGYGEPIISGLSLNDNATIMQGALPAAMLALLVQFTFDLIERLIIPKGLRIKTAGSLD